MISKNDMIKELLDSIDTNAIVPANKKGDLIKQLIFMMGSLYNEQDQYVQDIYYSKIRLLCRTNQIDYINDVLIPSANLIASINGLKGLDAQKFIEQWVFDFGDGVDTTQKHYS